MDLFFENEEEKYRGYLSAGIHRDQYILFTSSTVTISATQTPCEKKPGGQESSSTLGEPTSAFGKQEERKVLQRTFGSG